MNRPAMAPGGTRELDEKSFIVSKTDTRGRIVYANRTFIELSGYSEAELLGSDHQLVRHPDMPKGIFKLLWDALSEEREFSMYVKSIGKDGSSYWGYATMAPSHDSQDRVIGYFSVRRRPKQGAIPVIEELYRAMREEEVVEGEAGLRNSIAVLENLLSEKGMSYEEFVLDLQL